MRPSCCCHATALLLSCDRPAAAMRLPCGCSLLVPSLIAPPAPLQDPSTDAGPDEPLPPSATAPVSPRSFFETLAARLPAQTALATEANAYMAKVGLGTMCGTRSRLHGQRLHGQGARPPYAGHRSSARTLGECVAAGMLCCAVRCGVHGSSVASGAACFAGGACSVWGGPGFGGLAVLASLGRSVPQQRAGWLHWQCWLR
jgi:hypothetical protein